MAKGGENSLMKTLHQEIMREAASIPSSEKTTYCHTCERDFHYLGIASHRVYHRNRQQRCRITYTNGETYVYEYDKP